MNLLPCYKECFFCGPDGDGLKMKIRFKDGTVFCDFILAAKFQGYDNVAHGGIVAGILDEVMWWTIFLETKKICLTRKLDTEFLRPVYCGVSYTVKGKLLHEERGSIHVSAIIEDSHGKKTARGNGLFRIAKQATPGTFATKLDFSHVSDQIKDMFLAAKKPDDLIGKE
jgi:acyl-coenzyme A thioesterase PaaI-like protein